MNETYEDPNRRGVFIEKKKLSVVKCIDCGKPLMLAAQCKSCAIKSGKFIEGDKSE